MVGCGSTEPMFGSLSRKSVQKHISKELELNPYGILERKSQEGALMREEGPRLAGACETVRERERVETRKTRESKLMMRDSTRSREALSPDPPR